jgi:hypothetical protein
MSAPTLVRVLPNRRILAIPRSSSLSRSPYSEPGAIRLTVTLVTFPDGSRPSDCATTAAGTTGHDSRRHPVAADVAREENAFYFCRQAEAADTDINTCTSFAAIRSAGRMSTAALIAAAAFGMPYTALVA